MERTQILVEKQREKAVKIAEKVRLNDGEYFVLTPEEELPVKEARGEIEVNKLLGITRLDDYKYLIDNSPQGKYIILKDEKRWIEKLHEEILTLAKGEIEKHSKTKVLKIEKGENGYIFTLDRKADRPVIFIDVPLFGVAQFYKIDLKENKAILRYDVFHMIYLSKIKDRFEEVYEEVRMLGRYVRLISYIELD